MTDTIELLEAIGKDASLRHASAEALTKILEHAQASAALTSAVASGDSSLLSTELGHTPMAVPQVGQTPAHEDDESEDDEVKEPGESPSPASGQGHLHT